MFHKKIIEFFKNHNLYDEDMFDFISKNCQFVDYYDNDVNFLIGCPPRTDKYTNRITGFNIVLPYPWDEQTILVSIHELAHAIYWYKKLGKKYIREKDELECELFPMLVERTYVQENLSPNLQAYEEFLDGTIDEFSKPHYRFALKNRDELSTMDISEFNRIDKATRRLARKWRRQNR